MEEARGKKRAKIFISYARDDLKMANNIFNDLKNNGVDVWLDSESLFGGQNWREEIKAAIEESNYFLALLSLKSINRVGYVQKELKIALEILDLYPEKGVFVLPIRLEDCRPSHSRLKDLQWIDVFPKREYLRGIRKILTAINYSGEYIRSTPINIRAMDVHRLIREYDFYDCDNNPQGRGVSHKYRLNIISGEEVIIDESTNLIWQRGGSLDISYSSLNKFIKDFNKKGFAGHKDWRIPTIEEAMTLVEPKANKQKLHINPIFNQNYEIIWTSDKQWNWREPASPWAINFYHGSCWLEMPHYSLACRVVRSMEAFER